MEQPLKDKITAIILDVLAPIGNIPQTLTEDMKLKEDLGADSIDYIELAMAIEEEFNIEIPDEELDKIETVGDCWRGVEAILEKKVAA